MCARVWLTEYFLKWILSNAIKRGDLYASYNRLPTYLFQLTQIRSSVKQNSSDSFVDMKLNLIQ